MRLPAVTAAAIVAGLAAVMFLGHTYPGLFADCSTEGIFGVGTPERSDAIDEFRRRWILFAGLSLPLLLYVLGAWARELWPQRGTRVVGVLGVLFTACLVAGLVENLPEPLDWAGWALAAPMVLWFAITLPAVGIGLIGLGLVAGLAMYRWPQSRLVGGVLLGLVVSAWLAVAGFALIQSEGALAC